jgi:hypothetical protein
MKYAVEIGSGAMSVYGDIWAVSIAIEECPLTFSRKLIKATMEEQPFVCDGR